MKIIPILLNIKALASVQRVNGTMLPETWDQKECDCFLTVYASIPIRILHHIKCPLDQQLRMFSLSGKIKSWFERNSINQSMHFNGKIDELESRTLKDIDLILI